MAERMLSISNSMNMNDVGRIVNAVKNMGSDEQLVLSMDSQDSYRAENVFSILEKYDFEWSTKGGHNGREYYIIAKKKI